jgi:hypothetical protein
MSSTSNLIITRHCAVRAQQRGYQVTDLETVQRIATMAPEGLFVRWRDVNLEIQQLKTRLRRLRQGKKEKTLHSAQIADQEREIVRQIDRLTRLPGTFLPIEDGYALSVYRSSNRREKRVLRGNRTGSALWRHAR